ncbi:MAG: hypothetical protein KGI57_11430 [Hyphomicrobiales bacterium]|nr:hypothetical protein [Hyphomicrobiales bacterium]MDE2018298.1 hypothetical protein [Hyphomicrobiales bacterium]
MNGPVKYHLGEFPPVSLAWRRLVPFIGKANAALARYDGLISSIANPALLLSPLTTQEAVLSSKIEGTVVTMGEVLQIEASASLSQPKREAQGGARHPKKKGSTGLPLQMPCRATAILI